MIKKIRATLIKNFFYNFLYVIKIVFFTQTWTTIKGKLDRIKSEINFKILPGSQIRKIVNNSKLVTKFETLGIYKSASIRFYQLLYKNIFNGSPIMGH